MLSLTLKVSIAVCLCSYVELQSRQSYPGNGHSSAQVTKQLPSGWLIGNSSSSNPANWWLHWQQQLALQQQQAQQAANLATTTTIKTVSACGGGTAGSLLSRIIGGTEAATGEFPWQAAIQTPRGAFCGSVIVGPRHILTAAHCVAASGSLGYVLGFGSSDLATALSIGRSSGITVTRVLVHPNFDPVSLGNDIAILELSRPLPFSRTVSAACLPSQGDDVTRFSACVVTGWGTTSAQSSAASASLQKVVVPIQKDVTCSASYSTVFSDNRFCAGNIVTGGVDSCWGDSGGPLVCQDYGRYFLFGLVSSGVSCALPQYPGIYTEVSHFATWIALNVPTA